MINQRQSLALKHKSDELPAQSSFPYCAELHKEEKPSNPRVTRPKFRCGRIFAGPSISNCGWLECDIFVPGTCQCVDLLSHFEKGIGPLQNVRLAPFVSGGTRGFSVCIKASFLLGRNLAPESECRSRSRLRSSPQKSQDGFRLTEGGGAAARRRQNQHDFIKTGLGSALSVGLRLTKHPVYYTNTEVCFCSQLSIFHGAAGLQHRGREHGKIDR